MERAAEITNYDHGYFLSASQRTDGKSWPVSLWDATQGSYEPRPSVDEIATKAIQNHQATITWADRWLTQLTHRLSYERTMLTQDGCIAATRNMPEVGEACQCWASPRGGWSLIQKVNKVSVTLLDNWGNGGRDFTRTIPFDKLRAVMTRAEVEASRQAGRIVSEEARGFLVVPETRQTMGQAEQPGSTTDTLNSSPKPKIVTGIQTPRGPLTASGNVPIQAKPLKQSGLKL